ncbi:hypothetical protein F7725_000261 [Dissostichus mawsoni]|uniref:Uncharacterized protein n=1 Tax=Dissostichus mawsoni TaxID=36200 RepID=A0A7J5ZEE5_DISMA|nr:hypothetical protein F7725_000261 [Dissostichus mawsoni]
MAEFGERNGREAEELDGTQSRDVLEPVCGTGDPTVTVPRGLRCSNPERRKKLVLHVDLNNTILVSDSVIAQGTVAALEHFLSTVTWGRMSKVLQNLLVCTSIPHSFRDVLCSHHSQRHCPPLLSAGKWEWLSDSPSLHPPCDGAVSYHSHFGRTAGFSSNGEGGHLYHWILPSFFQLLTDLVHEGQEFAIVFRSFGNDLPRVLSAVSRALTEGAHPLFPDLPQLKLSVNMTTGKIRCSRKGIVLSRAEEHLSSRDGERGLYQWSSNGSSIRGGSRYDNIRQDDEHTIIQPKVFLEPGGADTRTACTSELYDITLVQTDLLKAISQQNYFTQRVHICLENYERNLQQGAG